MNRIRIIVTFLVAAALLASPLAAQPVAVEAQPLAANVARLLDALEFLGAPLFLSDPGGSLRESIDKRDAPEIQRLLDPHVLLAVHLNPESRVKVTRGPGKAVLQQGGWTPVLVRIENHSNVTAPLRIVSPQAGKVYAGASKGSLLRQEQTELRQNENTEGRSDRFLEVEMFDDSPMTAQLSGLELEYAIAMIHSHEAGKREATIGFQVGEGTQDLGFRGETPVLFDVRPAVPVQLRIRDFDGAPTTARLVFRDSLGRVYPSQAKRLAPDLFFQKQVYRSDGEFIALPPGEISIESSRGPEYVVQHTVFTVPADPAAEPVIQFDLERWTHPESHGFYSGDHHIHASGCAHYQSPTIGIDPGQMFRHVKGEGLNVGSILTWGPGFEHQRNFFRTSVDDVSENLTVMKYDLEISGFGSAPLGHVCLLNLSDQAYPGSEGTKTKGWPSWTIPVMRWAKEQGGITGYAHSASGLHVEPGPETTRLIANLDADKDGRISSTEAGDQLFPEPFADIDRNSDGHLVESELILSLNSAADELPNYAIPGMNGAGAMEIAISCAEGVCDFISAMDTARIQEWNTWYHLLNCGQRVAVSGETDFPCMSGTRVGQGRVYVQLGAVDRIDFGAWCKGLAAGRSYVSDGYAHALAFSVNGTSPGTEDLHLAKPGSVEVTAVVSFAPEVPIGVAYGNVDPPSGRRAIGDTVLLHIGHQDGVEKDTTRLVEIVVNGRPVASKKVPLDGKEHELKFKIPIEKSSWVALRHFPQLHTNPVHVLIENHPIRADRRSAHWCAEIIRKLWQNREKKIREDEREEARDTYQRAIEHYEKIAGETP